MPGVRLGCSALFEYPSGSRCIVLIQETKDHKKGLWNLPGGGVEYGDSAESVIRCATREAKEETGVDVRLLGILGVYQYRTQSKMHFAYAAEAVSGTLTTSKEHPGVQAYAYEDILRLEEERRLRTHRIVELMKQFQLGVIYPLDLIHVEGEDPIPDLSTGQTMTRLYY